MVDVIVLVVVAVVNVDKICKIVGTVWSLAERNINIGEPVSMGGVVLRGKVMET